MPWKELSISVPHEYVEPVSYLFSRYGKGLSTEPQGAGRVMLRTYLEAGSKQRLARIDVGVRLVASVGELGELIVRDLDDGEDWQKQLEGTLQRPTRRRPPDNQAVLGRFGG